MWGRTTGWEKGRIREISPAHDDHQSWGAHNERSSEEESMKGWKRRRNLNARVMEDVGPKTQAKQLIN